MALKDKLMTLEDFKAVRDVDVASNSAQFTEIKADLDAYDTAISDIKEYKTTVDVLAADNKELVSGYMIISTGEVSSTINGKYCANAGSGKINVSGCAGDNITVHCDPSITSWYEYAFFTSAVTLIGEKTRVTLTETDTETTFAVPSNAALMNFCIYANKNSVIVINDAIAATQLISKGVFGAEYLDDTLTLKNYPAQAKEVGDRFTAVGNRITELESQLGGGGVCLSLPDSYELVVGDTFQLFYKGIIKVDKPELYDIEITGGKGKPFSRYYELTPSTAENLTMTVKLYDPKHELIDSKTITLKVKAKATNPGTTKTVLYIGDSLTSGGIAPGEFKRRIVESNGSPTGDGLTNVSFIGKVSNGYVNYEGQGGRSWKTYTEAGESASNVWITTAGHDKTLTDQHSIYKDTNNKQWKLETIEEGRILVIRESASGTLPSSGTLTWVFGGEHTASITYTATEAAPKNPFWNTTANKIDMASYVTACGASSLDYIYILLGWNFFGTNETVTKNFVRTFVDAVLTDYPSCKITLLGLEIPARDGLAINYGTTDQKLARFHDAMEQVMNLNTWYEDISKETAYVGKVFFAQVSGQFDTLYNMPVSQKNVNTRNSTVKEAVQQNGVHPAEAGYLQIADVCYRSLTHRLQDS